MQFPLVPRFPPSTASLPRPQFDDSCLVRVHFTSSNWAGLHCSITTTPFSHSRDEILPLSFPRSPLIFLSPVHIKRAENGDRGRPLPIANESAFSKSEQVSFASCYLSFALVGRDAREQEVLLLALTFIPFSCNSTTCGTFLT